MALARINWRTLSLWQRFKQVPPILVRIMARNPRDGAVTTHEISERSGLSFEEVMLISSKLSWDGIDIPKAMAFQQAAGVDLADSDDVQRLRKELRRNRALPPHRRWPFLRRGSERPYMASLLSRYRDHLKRETK